MNNYYFLDKSIFPSFSPKVVNFVYVPLILFQIYLPILRSNRKAAMRLIVFLRIFLQENFCRCF